MGVIRLIKKGANIVCKLDREITAIVLNFAARKGNKAIIRGLISRKCVRKYNQEVKTASDLAKNEECRELLSNVDRLFQRKKKNFNTKNPNSFDLNLELMANQN